MERSEFVSTLARRSAIAAECDATIAKLGALFRELTAANTEAAREIRKDEGTRSKAYWANKAFADEETARRFRIALANAFADPKTGRSLFGEMQDATAATAGFTLASLYEKDAVAILGSEAAVR